MTMTDFEREIIDSQINSEKKQRLWDIVRKNIGFKNKLCDLDKCLFCHFVQGYCGLFSKEILSNKSYTDRFRCKECIDIFGEK